MELVERFRRNFESYQSSGYREPQRRREFLDPLFMALGWDVDNRGGHAEASEDVIHEDAKVGRATRAPDYCFRVGGARKFFVDAKRPGVDIKEAIIPAYQLRRYAWSAKLPLSIVSDFAEFAVYDCRIRPHKDDEPSTARILYLTYTDYITRWGEIAERFSRDAVLEGSLDRYAEASVGKRGTAEVDDAFLEDIERWRDLLARNIALRNSSLSERELNFAVQRTIDRIIFLRMCEDRGIEDYGRLQAVASEKNVYKRLCERFSRADMRYNSGLFHFRREKGRVEPPDDLTTSLSIDDAPLKEILGGLYFPDSPYEFSAIPADILGQVYERFLGKVIRLTSGHRAKVEDKPEVRKAGGVYYTPTFVVDYIVRSTIGRALAGATPKTAAKLRILDPACGSGCFLLGAYQFLLDWHRDWYIQDGPERWTRGKQPALFQGRRGEWQLTTGKRKEILLNSIYGVDIDAQAVEVTKLSLLLKVLEGETEETVSKNLQLFHERALPDLGNNIKCGNALIRPDFALEEPDRLADEESRIRINPFDWRQEFPSIIREDRTPDLKAKDAALGAAKTSGFDVILGNPPYIRIHRIGHDEADYLFEHYGTLTSKTDLSLAFLERSLGLVAASGSVGFICTSQWLATDYGREMRRLLARGFVREIVDFGSLPVFSGANTYPAILLVTPRAGESLAVRKVTSRRQLSLSGIESAAVDEVSYRSLTDGPWQFSGVDVAQMLGRAELPWKPLSAFGKAYIGAKSGLAEAFIVDEETEKRERLESAVLLPYAYQGAEVARYRRVSPNAKIIYPYTEGDDSTPVLIPEAELRRRYPRVHKHLSRFKDALRGRLDSRRLYASGEDWYRYLRAGTWRHIKPEKLVLKGISRRATAGLLGANTAFDGANCPSVIFDDLGGHHRNYFLGLFNSSVMTHYFRTVCPPKLSGYVRYSASYITAAPVRLIDFSEPPERAAHDRIVARVAQLSDLAANMSAARTEHAVVGIRRQIESLERFIDIEFLALYGATASDTAIIERSADQDDEPDETTLEAAGDEE